MSHPLPSDLVDALQRCRHVEALAESRDQISRAVDATARLLLAASQAGWRRAELAQVVGITHKAVDKRIREAIRPDHSGLDLTPAPPPTKHRAPPLPVEQREWLTRSQARRVAGVSDGTITFWRQAGLLPRTITLMNGKARYSRTDLERITAAPRWPRRGVDRAAVRDLMQAEVHT